ncbi:MAG: hypothetical protein RLZZ112_957 [Verrucomicrobiota bacterium]
MNKTLLLILCDFLLLNLLALTRWDKTETPPTTPVATRAASAQDDVVAALRLSLEEEKTNREKLAQDLATTRDESRSRAAVLDQARARTTELSERLQKTEQEATRLAQQAQVETERSRAALEAARAEAEALRLAKEKLRSETDALRSQLTVAEVQAKSAEEKVKLTTATLRQAEEEKKKLLEQNQSLSQGVTQLAEKSGEMTKEIREFRPVAPNALYADYLNRRATVRLMAERPSVQNKRNRRTESRSLLLTDGVRTAALVPLNQTPFSLGDSESSWDSLTGTLTLPPPSNFPKPLPALESIKGSDPRLLLAPVEPALLEKHPEIAYRIASDPFRFPKALLISPSGKGYGECTFKLEPSFPGYLEMDSRFLNRLQGEYAPEAGDIVLSLNGEFLGVMVNDQFCALVPSLEPGPLLPLDSKGASRGVGEALAILKKRASALDFRLQ